MTSPETGSLAQARQVTLNGEPYSYHIDEVDASEITSTRVVAAYIHVGHLAIVLGALTFVHDLAAGAHRAELVAVSQSNRRQGVAHALVEETNRIVGGELLPSDELSPDGKAFQEAVTGVPLAVAKHIDAKEAEAMGGRLLVGLMQVLRF